MKGKKASETAKKGFQPIFGCSQHMEAGHKTQHLKTHVFCACGKWLVMHSCFITPLRIELVYIVKITFVTLIILSLLEGGVGGGLPFIHF